MVGNVCLPGLRSTGLPRSFSVRSLFPYSTVQTCAARRHLPAGFRSRPLLDAGLGWHSFCGDRPGF